MQRLCTRMRGVETVCIINIHTIFIDVRTFELTVDSSRYLRLRLEGKTVDGITLSDPSKSQTSDVLAYRPNYEDLHDSGLAGIFVNIKKVFTCTEEIDEYAPICSTFTKEEDGFRKGKSYVELGDIGNNVKVFGNGVSVYALAVQGCKELTADCLQIYQQSEVVCLLPREQCP